VPHFAKIAFAQAEQSGAVDLRVAADEVMQPGMKCAAVAAVPRFLRLVGRIDEDGLGIPVVSGARQVTATF